MITKLDELRVFLDEAERHPETGMDVEATSLNTRKAKLVGISLACAPGKACYIPLAHRIGTNFPRDLVTEPLREFFENHLAIFYNAKYDLNVLQANLGWLPQDFEDALELVYLEDPDRQRKGLKIVAAEDLNFDMTRFEDLFTPEEQKAKVFNIATKSPQRCLDYAAADADATLRVWVSKQEIRQEQRFAVKIDTKLIDIVRRMEHNGGMVLNPEYIHTQIDTLTRRAEALREQIHRMVGYAFEIDSPKQLGIALFEKAGIPSQGLTRGKNPQYKTDAHTLEKIAVTYPVVEFVISYRKTVKARNTYFMKLVRLLDLGLKPRFNFNIFAAPTFRFAAPGGNPEVDGATGVNIQAVSNGEARDLFSVDLTPVEGGANYLEGLDEEDLLVEAETEEKKGAGLSWAETLKLDWVLFNEKDPPRPFCFRETCKGCPANCKAKGVDTTRRVNKGLKLIPSVRQAFMAPEGYTLVSVDYDRQELVIGANLSKEPRWVNALKRGEDLHLQTTLLAFNLSEQQYEKLPKAERKRKRDGGKILNFATFYGATAYTLALQTGIPQAMAEKVFDTFVKMHPQLFSWINKARIFARKNGYTTTYFGRKRWLKKFYQSRDRKMQAFADRSAVNTCIQGTGAEVTRIAMVKVAAALKRAGYTGKDVRFILQLHDELMFMVRDDLLADVVPLILDAMAFEVKSWDVQLTCSPKIGRVWGKQRETTREEICNVA